MNKDTAWKGKTTEANHGHGICQNNTPILSAPAQLEDARRSTHTPATPPPTNVMAPPTGPAAWQRPAFKFKRLQGQPPSKGGIRRQVQQEHGMDVPSLASPNSAAILQPPGDTGVEGACTGTETTIAAAKLRLA